MERYLSDKYVFIYLRTRSELLRDPDRLRALSLDLSKLNSIPAVCVIVTVLVDLMNDQVSSLQRKGIAANLHQPFYCFESTRRSMTDFWEQRFYSLPLVATSVLNII